MDQHLSIHVQPQCGAPAGTRITLCSNVPYWGSFYLLVEPHQKNTRIHGGIKSRDGLLIVFRLLCLCMPILAGKRVGGLC